MAKLTHEDILAYLEEATILELNDLVKAIEEKFDVTAVILLCIWKSQVRCKLLAGISFLPVPLTSPNASRTFELHRSLWSPPNVDDHAPRSSANHVNLGDHAIPPRHRTHPCRYE